MAFMQLAYRGMILASVPCPDVEIVDFHEETVLYETVLNSAGYTFADLTSDPQSFRFRVVNDPSQVD